MASFLHPQPAFANITRTLRLQIKKRGRYVRRSGTHRMCVKSVLTNVLPEMCQALYADGVEGETRVRGK